MMRMTTKTMCQCYQIRCPAWNHPAPPQLCPMVCRHYRLACLRCRLAALQLLDCHHCRLERRLDLACRLCHLDFRQDQACHHYLQECQILVECQVLVLVECLERDCHPYQQDPHQGQKPTYRSAVQQCRRLTSRHRWQSLASLFLDLNPRQPGSRQALHRSQALVVEEACKRSLVLREEACKGKQVWRSQPKH